MNAAAQAISQPDYVYWRNALSGKFGDVHDGDPQLGFYRKRTGKAQGFSPVAIWEQVGRGIVAIVDGQEASAADIWTFVCQHPVTEQQYRERIETGKWWDEDAATTASLSHDLKNSAADPSAIMADQIDAALAGVSEYDDIRSDETAARAQSLRSRLLELSGQADKTREAEKKPHLEAGRAVDALWQPLVKKAKEGADAIRKALSAHETRKDQERRAAEAARLKSEQETAAAHTTANPAAPEPTTAIRGAYGRAASVKPVKVATVTDQDAAYNFLKTHKELVELIGKLAQRAVDAGYAVPGVSVEERKEVR